MKTEQTVFKIYQIQMKNIAIETKSSTETCWKQEKTHSR